MRISDWSSDVCSSDLLRRSRQRQRRRRHNRLRRPLLAIPGTPHEGDRQPHHDQQRDQRARHEFLLPLRTLVVTNPFRSEERREGKSVSVRVDLGGSRINKKKKKTSIKQQINTQ